MIIKPILAKDDNNVILWGFVVLRHLQS